MAASIFMLSRMKIFFNLFLITAAIRLTYCTGSSDSPGKQRNSSHSIEVFFDEREDIEPIFMWTSDRSVSFPDPMAGRTMSERKFIDGYLKPVQAVADMNFVFFIHEEMTLADLMMAAKIYGQPGQPSVFSNIYEMMDNMPSAFIARVQHPVVTLSEELSSRFPLNRIQPVIGSKLIDNPNSLVLDLNHPNLLVCQLRNIAGNGFSEGVVKRRRATFQYIDRIAGILKARLDADGRPYTFIYTSLGSPNTVPEMKVYRYVNGVKVEWNRGRVKRSSDSQELVRGRDFEEAQNGGAGADFLANLGDDGAGEASGIQYGASGALHGALESNFGVARGAGSHIRAFRSDPRASGDVETKRGPIVHNLAHFISSHLSGHHHGLPDGLVVEFGAFLLYAGNVSVVRNGSEERLETEDEAWSVEEEESECEEVEPGHWNSSEAVKSEPAPKCKIVLHYKHPLPEVKMSKLSMVWLFERYGRPTTGAWSLESFTLRYVPLVDDATEEKEVTPVTQQMWKGFIEETPMAFSYHCHDTVHVRPIRAHNKTHDEMFKAHDDLQLRWDAFQVQVFQFHTPRRFGYYNDCTGFFTAGIWSAIITMAMFVGVVTFGVNMLMGVSTMDRFDDPKGKGMSITVSE